MATHGIWDETAVCFNYKHSDGGPGGGCSIVLVVLPFVSLINGSYCRVNTAATLQAVYLVWLFLRITTTCNLSIIGLVRKRFPESFAHAQTVDTRPLFSPPTWPGYEANLQVIVYVLSSILSLVFCNQILYKYAMCMR